MKKRKISDVASRDEPDDVSSVPDKKPKLKNLYKPPTHDELQTLKETESLYRTNLIKLQINEMMAEIKPNNNFSELEILLHKLRKYLMKIPCTDKVKLSDGLSLVPSSVQYPLNFVPPSQIKGHFQFSPPTKIKVIGSHLLNACLKKNANIDLSIQIPQDCIQEKDHLNYRYFHKRAIYLCIMADYLLKKKKQLVSTVRFNTQNSNPLLPILTITLKGDTRYTVHIHTCISKDSFPFSKFSPSKNNVRWFASPHPLTQSRDGINPPPTPLYNTAMLMEMESYERHLKELYSVSIECPSITEATLLCKTWLHQKQLDKGYGGFTGFHCSMIFLYLFSQQKLNQQMSSYQLFRILLQFISTTNWDIDGISIADRKMYPSLPPLEEYHAHFPVVFIDMSGYLNLTANISLQQYHLLKYEAGLCHGYLDSGDHGFVSVFLRPVSNLLRYDSLCKIDLLADEVKGSAAVDVLSWDRLALDNGGWVWPMVLDKIMKIVTQGFDGRVQLIGHFPFQQNEWDVSETPPTLTDGRVTLGLIFNTESIFNPLILGPPADSNEATSFRSFWGQKSELRKFPDSGINEAVLWEGQGEWQKRKIPEHIMEHILLRHTGISHTVMTHCLMDDVIYANGSTGEEESVSVVNSFTELSRQLRQLKGLPLDIATVQGASPVFCHSEAFPPCPWNGKMSTKYQSFPQQESDVQMRCLYPSDLIATPPFIPALNVVLQMEASGKWPTDPVAINDIKTAFYLDIAKCVWKQYHLITVPSKNHLDILKDGYVFRLTIYNTRELTLLKELKKTSSVENIERFCVFRPLLTSTLTGLHNQFASFSLGVRLAKRWVCSHLLSNQISEEAIELLVAHLFLHPDPFTVPGSAFCVFLRFLKLLGSHDWSHDPLIVNFNGQFTAEKLTEITTQFNNQRHAYPLMFIATPVDPASTCTRTTPTAPILNRLIVLARGSLELLTNQIDSLDINQREIPPDNMQVFRTPLHDYNLLIYLKKKFIAHKICSSSSTVSTEPTHLPIVQYDPVHCYVQSLEMAFSDYALFFYDKYDGHVIGVLWKPDAFKPHPFKVYKTQCCNTHSRDGKKLTVIPNKDTMINDFLILGEGLVEKVIVPPTN